MPDGNILYGPGDCTFFGINGHEPPQLDDEWCGKIHILYPDQPGVYKTVAKGVRNSQQMRLYNGNTRLAFMEIGGVTAEEVNSYDLADLENTNDGLANFGWGRNTDGFAREGTFYVEDGIGGILGTQPPCLKNTPIPEDGFVQPWVQFCHTPDDAYYGISSLAIPSSGSVEMLYTEFNTGILMGTDSAAQDPDEYAGPATAYKYKLFAEDDTEISAFNELVQEELGEVGYYRGDPRLFHYPDGTVGVFIERTGVFYKLTEVALLA